VDKWKADNLTWENVSTQAKVYLPILTRAGYKAITEPAQKIAQQSSLKAKEAAQESSQNLSSYTQRASSQAKSAASQLAQQGKETIIAEAHTMKRDIFRLIWW
jgi:hypothetical protein